MSKDKGYIPRQGIDDQGSKVDANEEVYRFDLLDAGFLISIASVMGGNAQTHTVEGWKKFPPSWHLGRAMGHILKATEKDEDHLANAACRLMFAHALMGKALPVDEPTSPAQSPPDTATSAAKGVPTSPEPNERLDRVRPKDRNSPTGPRLAYLCHPHGENPINIQDAVDLAARLQTQLLQEGDPTYLVVPHNMWPFLSHLRPYALQASMEVMKRCDIVLVPAWGAVTEGMKEEIKEAKRGGMSIYRIEIDDGIPYTLRKID